MTEKCCSHTLQTWAGGGGTSRETSDQDDKNVSGVIDGPNAKADAGLTSLARVREHVDLKCTRAGEPAVADFAAELAARLVARDFAVATSPFPCRLVGEVKGRERWAAGCVLDKS